MMGSTSDLTPPHVDASLPSLGFPLGTGLLLVVIFSVSGIVSCCYHWDKLKFLRGSFPDRGGDLEAPPLKDISACAHLKKNQSQSLPVLMPGDEIPKFMALPCPCEPPRPEKLVVAVQKPPPLLPVPFHSS